MRPASCPDESLSVVIPVHDEAASLPRLYEELCQVLDGLDRAAEIIVVDDGSTDGGADVVRGLVATGPGDLSTPFQTNTLTER